MKKNEFILIPIVIFFLARCTTSTSQPIPADNWFYIEIDNERAKWGDYAEPDWLRYFGLDMHDINGDGYAEILAGKEIYINPGGNMTGKWEKSMLPINADGILFLDVDGDQYGDIIAQALPDVYWFEAVNKSGTKWKAVKIAEIVATEHVNSQGFEKGDFIAGGKNEFILSGGDAVYLFEISNNPEKGNWTVTKIGVTNSAEGLGYGDLDDDGDLDIVSGRSREINGEINILVWFENPGDGSSNWEDHEIGISNHDIDRIEVGDLNGDKKLDIAISEERYPGLEPDANLFWYQQPANNPTGNWQRHRITTQYSMNSLDIADIDGDGDIDLVTNEHKGPNSQTQIWENNGRGEFNMILIDKGKESHLGTQLYDMDGDGDLDNVSIAWDNYKLLHLWRNDAINITDIAWKHYSTINGDFPVPNGGKEQTATLVTDLDNDGVNDFIITERTNANSVVWYKKSLAGWDRFIIEEDALHIEAGSAHYDIDADGDVDIVFAGDSQDNHVWWWENPFPNFDKPWKRHDIKNTGRNQHHDQMFGDFDGDGKVELVFWNQVETCLYMAEIPANPAQTNEEWKRRKVYSYSRDSQMLQRGHEGYPDFHRNHDHEGLYSIDIDGDGLNDIVGGGRWFKYNKSSNSFIANIVDASYVFTRSIAGDFIEGGRPEIAMVVGDGIAKLVLYEYQGKGTWVPTEISEVMSNGHTLRVLDFNGDGHLDIFTGEMRFGEGNPKSKIRIMLGDGNGKFTNYYVALGFGMHEGQIADLDGDGDYDILSKPYSWKTPRLDIWINESE